MGQILIETISTLDLRSSQIFRTLAPPFQNPAYATAVVYNT